VAVQGQRIIVTVAGEHGCRKWYLLFAEDGTYDGLRARGGATVTPAILGEHGRSTALHPPGQGVVQHTQKQEAHARVCFIKPVRLEGVLDEGEG